VGLPRKPNESKSVKEFWREQIKVGLSHRKILSLSIFRPFYSLPSLCLPCRQRTFTA
jgi:hypothetical protein